MRVLAIAQVEDRANLDTQILKQTVRPDRTVFYVDKSPAHTITERRKRIAWNHQKLRHIVQAYESEYVWQLEGDVDLPEDALESLLKTHASINDPQLGYVSGVQVGRHGIYALGAWHVQEDAFQSLDYKSKGLQQVDATGFYCLLAKRDVWLQGECSWSGEPYGPDVVWSLSLEYNKYVDMNLKIGHKTSRGTIHPDQLSTCNVRFYKDGNDWKYKTYE